MAALYGNKGPGALVGDGRGGSNPGDDVTFGTPAPNSPSLGTPTDNRFGAPGTAGTSPSSPSGTAALADSLLKATPDGAKIVEKDLKDRPPAEPGSVQSSYP
jgi:hypothetical protein